MINRIRAVCVAIAVMAFLVYLNTSQMADASETSLYSVGALNTTMAETLSTRQTEVLTSAWVEYGALVAAGYAILLAATAPRLARLRRGRA